MHINVNVSLQYANYIMSQEFLSGSWIIESIWRLPSFELNTNIRKTILGKGVLRERQSKLFQSYDRCPAKVEPS